MEPELEGCRIWLTRPADQAQELVRALADAGVSVEHVPALAIEALPPGDSGRITAERLFAEIDRFDHLFFISTNAVEHGMALITPLHVALPAGIVCHAIGAATARALIEHGVTASAVLEPMNSEALLGQPSLRALTGQRVLIVRGVGGRRRLGDVLSSRGADVRYAEVYRRSRPAALPAQLLAVLVAGRIDLIIAASGETVENIVVLTAACEAVLATPLVVPGARVAALARQLGFEQVAVARSAATTAILAAVVAFLGDRRGDADHG